MVNRYSTSTSTTSKGNVGRTKHSNRKIILHNIFILIL